MLRNLLVLPDGTELFSGTDTTNAIQSVTLTQTVNVDTELTIGSVCASMLEAKLITPGGGSPLTAGDEVTLYKVTDGNDRRKIGVFTLEKPTRTTANTMKITGYDHMVKLDKDLTTWLDSLTGWPYNIVTFASMVCAACGVSFVSAAAPNTSFQLRKFSASGVTGRQLLKWIGEVTCSFFRADADGKIRMDWYAPLHSCAIGCKEGQFDEIFFDKYTGELSFMSPDVSGEISGDELRLTSDRFTLEDDGEGNITIFLQDCIETLPYFQNGLGYEEYNVLPADGVQLRLGEGSSGYLWPAAAEGANTYIISGNPLLQSANSDVQQALENIRGRLSQVSYTPCKVTIPACVDITAGNILRLTDKNGKTITIYAMTVTTAGQKMTIACTGSHRRDSTQAVNNPSSRQEALEVAQGAAGQAAEAALEQAITEAGQLAQDAVDNQTQLDIFNKLTDGGKLQGLYMENGQLYINASYLAAGTIKSQDGTTFSLDIANNTLKILGKTVSWEKQDDGSYYLVGK